jgi:hypothetical protein
MSAVDIFDLRPGNTFVESLREPGFDVFPIDGGYPRRRTALWGSAWRVSSPRQPSAAPKANRGHGGGDDQDSQRPRNREHGWSRGGPDALRERA